MGQTLMACRMLLGTLEGVGTAQTHAAQEGVKRMGKGAFNVHLGLEA